MSLAPLPTDPVLAAVLDSRESTGASWREMLPDSAHADAEAWDALADQLAGALRMGPGGLSDGQRARILEAAAHPIVLGTGKWSGPLPKPAGRPGPGLLWKWLAISGAAAAVVIFGLGRSIPVPGGIDPAQWQANLMSTRPTGDARFDVRVLPGPAAGSRYAIAPPGTTTQLASDLDWSAVGPGGGFQPAAMGNVAEIVPLPSLSGDGPDEATDLGLAASHPAGQAGLGLIQQFSFDYPEPADGEAVALTVESGPCPWNPGNQLVHIGLRATADPRMVPGRHSLAAKDVRLRVDFNPGRVAAYRLVGNGPAPRRLQGEAVVRNGAELLAGQSATAIYEVVPAGASPRLDHRARWTNTRHSADLARADEMLTARVVYRLPGKNHHLEHQIVLNDSAIPDGAPSEGFRFASAVAACSLLLDNAPGMQHYRMDDALALARASIGEDRDGKRGEFVRLLAARGARP